MFVNEVRSTGGSDPDTLRTWSARAVNPQRWAAIEEHLGESFLDVGCGNGSYVLKLANRVDARGVDVEEYESWSARRERFQIADAADLPFEDSGFDTVVCFEVIEHVPDPVKVLKELARVARKYVIVSVPNCEVPEGLFKSRLTYFHYTDRSHVNFFTTATLKESFESAGITVSNSRLINPCNPTPVVSEMFHCSERVAKILVKLFARETLHMTCLAVGEVG